MHKNSEIPQHVAIIMDGNGRWARRQNKERIEGHINGVESVRNAFKSCLRHGIRYLTLYAFSTENWGRPAEEVQALMELFCKCVIEESTELIEQGVRIRVIGKRDNMSDKVIEHLDLIEKTTSEGDKLDVLLALNYGSREEISDACASIISKIQNGQLDGESLSPEMISANLYTSGIPDPDLLIRTGGERRLSNFLLWQLSYAELYFTDVFWPEFDQAHFDMAISEYSRRDRRYGLVEEKI